jgi:CheY-like chemotaxis protein
MFEPDLADSVRTIICVRRPSVAASASRSRLILRGELDGRLFYFRDKAAQVLRLASDSDAELKQYPALVACSQGVKWMGLVESKRPVVLIVEDEFLLRMDAVDMIRAAGFDVVEAENADEAIEILEARLDITVVFTDIQMPGSMDGLRLAQAVRGRWPPIKIVATSGHVNVREKDLPEGGRFLPKPYSSREVTGVLRELTSG